MGWLNVAEVQRCRVAWRVCTHGCVAMATVQRRSGACARFLARSPASRCMLLICRACLHTNAAGMAIWRAVRPRPEDWEVEHGYLSWGDIGQPSLLTYTFEGNQMSWQVRMRVAEVRREAGPPFGVLAQSCWSCQDRTNAAGSLLQGPPGLPAKEMQAYAFGMRGAACLAKGNVAHALAQQLLLPRPAAHAGLCPLARGAAGRDWRRAARLHLE